MADIFLSYSRKDEARAQQLAEAFAAAGYSVWWDHKLRSGAEFASDIETALREAHHVVVAWSEDAVQSRWVRDEASEAADQGKLVSLSLDGTPPPIGFRQFHATDISAWRGGPLPTALLEALGGDAPQVEGSPAPVQPAKSARPGLIAAALAGLLVLGAASWWAISGSVEAGGETQLQPQDMKIVAVLPFVAGSPGEDDQYFADGVSEEILNRLDALPEIRVIPRTTSFSYQGSDKSLQAIADELNVGHIVEGSMRRSGDDVRVTARLVRASDLRSLWSKTYDVSTDDVFRVQADIAESVAGALDVLLDDNKRAQMAKAGVDNPEAFAMYARALYLMAQAHNPDHSQATFYGTLEEASAVFDRAFEAEPKLWMAPFWSADLESHVLIDQASGVEDTSTPSHLVDDARPSLDAKLSRAASGALRRKDRLYVDIFRQAFSDDWSDILSTSEEIWELRDVCDMPNWTGFLAFSQGQAGDAFDFMKPIGPCLAQNSTFATYLAYAGMWSGRLEEAERLLRPMIPAQGETRIQQALGEVLAAQGKDREVREVIEQIGPEAYKRTLLLMIGDRSTFSHEDAIEMRQSGRAQAGIRALALAGERALANDWAAEIDKHPAGPTVLQIIVDECVCGAPFDLEYTPRYAERLKGAGASWPPKLPFEWPLKNW